MLDEVCAYLKNYFDRDQEKYFGEIVIENGELTGFEDKLQNGQYFRIVGSVFNDGVYQYPATGLTDESFSNGAVWAMAVPPAMITIANEIAAWQDKNGALDSQAMSPFNSESFGGYSYSKSGGGTSDTGYDSSTAWQSVFKSRLARWRKL